MGRLLDFIDSIFYPSHHLHVSSSYHFFSVRRYPLITSPTKTVHVEGGSINENV